MNTTYSTTPRSFTDKYIQEIVKRGKQQCNNKTFTIPELMQLRAIQERYEATQQIAEPHRQVLANYYNQTNQHNMVVTASNICTGCGNGQLKSITNILLHNLKWHILEAINEERKSSNNAVVVEPAAPVEATEFVSESPKKKKKNVVVEDENVDVARTVPALTQLAPLTHTSPELEDVAKTMLAEWSKIAKGDNDLDWMIKQVKARIEACTKLGHPMPTAYEFIFKQFVR